MARYYSDDGILDAPVAKVWKLIEAHNDPKNHIHASILSMKGAPQPDGSFLADLVTQAPDGRGTMSHKWRFTLHPPHAQTVEMVDGPLKGSWMTTTYVPEPGNKTRLVTVAEWKVQGVSDEPTLRKMANDFFDNGFEEDTKFLRAMK
jgi:hypothetical protein